MEEYRRTHLDRDRPEWLEDELLARLVLRYEENLRDRGLLDFDDMVLIGLRMVESSAWIRRAIRARFPILVVDEYQDLGVPLHRLVMSLCIEGGIRLLAVGDPDQSIYGFTGARPELLRALAERRDLESVRLRFNYRSGKTLVSAAEAALGERRGYEAKGSAAGSVDAYECPTGLEEQAARICEAIIPAALARRPGRVLGDIAVLYADRNDGDVIARKVAEAGLKATRVDRGAPYAKTPLTRWLEDCAKWCGGGWKQGTPRLSGLIGTWLGFNRTAQDRRERHDLRVRLMKFLLNHRSQDTLARDWIVELEKCCLGAMLARERVTGGFSGSPQSHHVAQREGIGVRRGSPHGT